MVVVMLAGVMFPLWPPTMRLGVWYLSMGCLGLVGLFFVIAIVRLIFYIITVVVASPGIWIFPKLFADVGFVRPIPYSLPFTSLIPPPLHRSNPSFHYTNGISPRKNPKNAKPTNLLNPNQQKLSLRIMELSLKK